MMGSVRCILTLNLPHILAHRSKKTKKKIIGKIPLKKQKNLPISQNARIRKTKKKKKDKNEKDKNLGIREFVRQLNYDAFMHRQGEGKSILPKEYFLNVLLGRLKMVELNGYNKSLRQLNMEEDKLL